MINKVFTACFTYNMFIFCISIQSVVQSIHPASITLLPILVCGVITRKFYFQRILNKMSLSIFEGGGGVCQK